MDPEFERAFVTMMSFLGERVQAATPPYCALSCQALVRALSHEARTVRAHAMAPELLRIRFGLDRLELR